LPTTWFEGSLMVFWATRCAMKGEPWKTALFSCAAFVRSPNIFELPKSPAALYLKLCCA
jgi:hypothetical protein